MINRQNTIMTFNGHYSSNVSKEFTLFISKSSKFASKQIT